MPTYNNLSKTLKYVKQVMAGCGFLQISYE